MSFVQLIRNCRRALQRKAEQCEQGKERRGPKIPEWAKQGRKAGEKNRRARDCGKEHEKPQLAAAHAPRKAEKSRGEQQHKECVERIGERTQLSPPQAQRAQQVVNECQANAQQKRAGERARLRSDLHAHRRQGPKRREKRPPERGASS